ncbi:MAG: hypothetical protein ACOYOQ_00570 [Microthrixaceae bacterium]
MPDGPPGKLRVGPFTYRVVVDEGRIPSDLYGACDKSHHVISLHPNQSGDRLRATLLHEVIHALCDVAAVDDDKAEEAVATRLAPLLLDVLRDNPRLVEYLTGG